MSDRDGTLAKLQKSKTKITDMKKQLKIQAESKRRPAAARALAASAEAFELAWEESEKFEAGIDKNSLRTVADVMEAYGTPSRKHGLGRMIIEKFGLWHHFAFNPGTGLYQKTAASYPVK